MHGAHLTEDQAKILRGLGATTVVCMTDNDRAGDEATHTIKAALPGLAVLVGWYRPHWQGKDPAELHPIRRRQMFSEALHYSKAFRGV
jgi:DNA primase